jgi:hypothetical protein
MEALQASALPLGHATGESLRAKFIFSISFFARDLKLGLPPILRPERRQIDRESRFVTKARSRLGLRAKRDKSGFDDRKTANISNMGPFLDRSNRDHLTQKNAEKLILQSTNTLSRLSKCSQAS